MSASPRISIAVCTRNRSRTLADTLQSLIDQDHPRDDYEIVVIDDGSIDATADVVERLAHDHDAPAIVYLRQQPSGLSAARNRAVRSTASELICYVDDDAVAEPGWLRAIADGAARHPEVDCFAGRILLRLEGRAPRTCGRESLAAELDEGDEEGPVRFARGANMAMRRSAFHTVGLFNPALVWRGDEVDWQRRLVGSGGRILYLPEALVWHRRSADDLRWGRLVRTKFGSGVGQVQYRREAGLGVSYGREVRAILFGLLHAVRRRCPGGLLRSVNHAGVLWGVARGELRQPPTTAPAYPEDAERV